MKRVVLTIAGSDSGGGAGIQADIKTISALGGFAVTVITALTAQNLHRVSAIEPASAAMVYQQLQAVFEGFPVAAAKCGMLFNQEIIATVADFFKTYPQKIKLVVDPVFAATSGSKLITDTALKTIQEELFPLATLITPNIPEAEILSGFRINSMQLMRESASVLARKFKTNFLIKGGHLPDDASDILVEFKKEREKVFKAKKISGVNTHGSGCSYAAAIATMLAEGEDLPVAVAKAKSYLTSALKKSISIGNEKLINHFWRGGKGGEKERISRKY